MDIGVSLQSNEYCMKIQMKLFQAAAYSDSVTKGQKKDQNPKMRSLNAFLKKT
jgi:hypothetical protein